MSPLMQKAGLFAVLPLIALLLWLESAVNFWQPGPYNAHLQTVYAGVVLVLFLLFLFGMIKFGAFLLRVAGYGRETEAPIFLAFLVGISVLNIAGTAAGRFDLISRPIALIVVALACVWGIFYCGRLNAEGERSLNIPAVAFWILLVVTCLLRGVAPDIRGGDTASHYTQFLDFIREHGGFRALSDGNFTMFYVKGLGSNFILTIALGNPFPTQLMTCAYIAMACGIAVHVHSAAWGGSKLLLSFIFGFLMLHFAGFGRIPMEYLKAHSGYGYYILTLAYLPVYLRQAPPLPRTITALIYAAAASTNLFSVVALGIIDGIKTVFQRSPIIPLVRRGAWYAVLVVSTLLLNWLLYRIPEMSLLNVLVKLLGFDFVDRINDTISFEDLRSAGRSGGIGISHLGINKLFNITFDGVAYTYSFLFGHIWFRAMLGTIYILGFVGMVGLARQLGREPVLITSIAVVITYFLSTLFIDMSSIYRVYWLTDILRIIYLVYGIRFLLDRLPWKHWLAAAAIGCAAVLTVLHLDFGPLKFIAGVTDTRAAYGSFLTDSCIEAKKQAGRPVVSLSLVWGCFSYKDTRFIGMRFFDNLYIDYRSLLTEEPRVLWLKLRERNLTAFFWTPGDFSNTIFLYSRIFDPDTINRYVKISWQDKDGAVLLELKDQSDDKSSPGLSALIEEARANDPRMMADVARYRQIIGKQRDR